MKVLIVDDSRAMRMIVMRTLRQAGLGEMTIQEASNGAEALKAIRAELPDIVLSDWNMPVMTGMELLQHLKTEGIHVKLGFVTSESSDEMKKTAKDTGALFFITKPFSPELLQDAQPVIGYVAGPRAARACSRRYLGQDGGCRSCRWCPRRATMEYHAGAAQAQPTARVRRAVRQGSDDEKDRAAHRRRERRRRHRHLARATMAPCAPVRATQRSPAVPARRSLCRRRRWRSAVSSKAGRIADTILENLREVLNIAHQFFHDPGTPHMILREVLVTPCSLPAHVAQVLGKPAGRSGRGACHPWLRTGQDGTAPRLMERSRRERRPQHPHPDRRG
ncbi:MAG: response regulator [Planctomycetota bacterium]